MLQELVTKAEELLHWQQHSRKREEESVLVDDVTKLPSKEQHKKDATRILQNRKGAKYAYVSCDVSGFKYINETYGYAYGNVVLRYIATVFAACLGKDELVSRTTGDHFCILLRYQEQDALKERILSMLDQVADYLMNEEGIQRRLIFNCGVYLIHKNEDINMIRARASAARKRNAKGFRDQIVFYNENDFAKELEAKELEADIRHAVEHGELKVYLQPKYDILSEHVIGAEALIRWEHPEKGMLGPGMFVPACEANGFICEIDFFVLEEVCRKMREWKEEGKKLVKVSTNFSRRHLSDVYFVDKLIETVKRYGIDPKDIEIELTESIAYEEMDTLLAAMHRIKEAGFGLSMDDFGSGYSSLALLREMPVDVLKLDKGFLDNCGSHDTEVREKRIIAHIISMAKDLNISVLAEGVETIQQKDFLKESKCDMIQGYYYAKPMPPSSFENYLEAIA